VKGKHGWSKFHGIVAVLLNSSNSTLAA